MIQEYGKQLKQVLFVLFFKIIFIIFVPLTGDEAYFLKWGENLLSGYYDHPPMVGWLIYFMSFIYDDYIFYRFFSFLTALLVAFVIYKLAIIFNTEKSKAYLIALIFLISPVDILMSLYTNDIALILFSSFGVLFFVYAYEKNNNILYSILAGIFLGLAFLSKYFVAFLMFSLIIAAFYLYGKKAYKNLLIMAVITLLFVFQNFYFNYNNCWNNIMFNFFARTKDNSFGFDTIALYLGFIIYLFTPWALYFIVKSRNSFFNSKLLKLLVSILLLAFVVFLIVSLKNKVGLHWLLIYVPFMYLLFAFLKTEILEKIFKFNFVFTLVHIVLLSIILLIPKEYFKKEKSYADIVMFTQPQKICEQLTSFDKLYALGYTEASVLSYHCKKDIKMLFNNSKYGRLDDKLFDVRQLQNQDVYLVSKNNKISKQETSLSCKDGLETLEILEFGPKNFTVSVCKNFNFEGYKKEYLDIQKQRFYNIPKWLPIGQCYFNDRYYK